MKYTMWLPIGASAKFVLETDEELTDDEARERMIAEGQPVGSLCHQCARGIETDCEMDMIYVEQHIQDFDVTRSR